MYPKKNKLECCYSGCNATFDNSPRGALDRTLHEAAMWHCSGCGWADMVREVVDVATTELCDLCKAKQGAPTTPAPSNVVHLLEYKRNKKTLERPKGANNGL